jgi:hypothetical protein
MPATPSSNLPLRNPKPLAFASTPRTGVGTAMSIPGSGRFHQTASTPQMNVADGPRAFSGPKLAVAGIRRSLGGGDLDVPRHPLKRTEGSCCHVAVLPCLVPANSCQPFQGHLENLLIPWRDGHHSTSNYRAQYSAALDSIRFLLPVSVFLKRRWKPWEAACVPRTCRCPLRHHDIRVGRCL